MKKKITRKIVLVLGTIVVMSAFAFGPSLIASGDERGSAAESTTPLFSVKTENAQKRTLRAFLEVNGDIVSGQETDVFPDVSGKLVRMAVSLGAQVRRGTLIAEVNASKPGAKYMNSPVYAPISGTISQVPFSAGSTVSQGTSVATISITTALEINARIPEREISGLREGLAAEVSLQAYPGEIFSATIKRVSPVLDAASRTKQISLVFDQNDSRINAGMFARIRINTKTHDDVLAVSSESIVNKHGEQRVYVVRNDVSGMPCTELRKVETGATLDGWTEIRSGIEEGEAVVVQGQQLLSGGEAVQVAARNKK